MSEQVHCLALFWIPPPQLTEQELQLVQSLHVSIEVPGATQKCTQMGLFHCRQRAPSLVILCKFALPRYTLTEMSLKVCGSVGRAVSSNYRGWQFESSHWKQFKFNIYCQLY